jgi:hypothetical protein
MSVTILGSKGHNVNEENEAVVGVDTGALGIEHNPLSRPDANNYLQAETLSNTFGGGLVSKKTGCSAHACYSFDG